MTNCRADEDRDLAERDGLRLVEIARGPKDDEQRFAVALQLRTLMGLDRVLDREFMEIELARDRGELLLARFVQTEPRDRIAGHAGGVQLGEVVRLRHTTAIAIDGTIDDHAGTVSRPRVGLDYPD